MIKPRRWWLGLLPLALIWLAAVWVETELVEQYLATRTVEAAKTLPLHKVHATARGRDVILSGQAFSEHDRHAALAAARTAWGVRTLRDAMQHIPEAKPFSWSATRVDDEVILAGNVPSPTARTKLIGAARATIGSRGIRVVYQVRHAVHANASAVQIVDQMSYARGAPDGFEKMAELGLAQLGELSNGKLIINDASVSISGTAEDAPARKAIKAALSTLPSGFELKKVGITAPGYTFEAVKNPTAATLRLSGSVPDTKTRDNIIEAARRQFFGEAIIDNLQVADDAPSGFSAAVQMTLDQLARLDHGSVEISNTDIRIVGEVLYPQAAEQIKEAVAKAKLKDFEADVTLTVKPPGSPIDASTCQRMFNAALTAGTVQFDKNSAAIDKDSLGLLDYLAAVAMRCRSADIEVGGHTDSSGSDRVNQHLSRLRAQAVVDYLVEAGLDTSHLTARGFGSSKPIASNATENGRARNRRIEFLVTSESM